MKYYINIDITDEGFQVWIPNKIARWLFRKLFNVEVTHESAIGSCGRIVIKNKGYYDD